MSSLKGKTIRGIGWSAVENFSKNGVTFIVSIILARLLSPHEYGLIGILNIIITLFNTIVDGGFSNALIRKPNVTEDDYNTAFIVNLIIAFIMATLMFISAPLIASFFDRVELLSLTRVMSFAVIINAFSIVQRTKLTKSLDFKALTQVALFSSITSGVVGIILAFLGFGVWSLVGQVLSLYLLTAVVLNVVSRWLPKTKFCCESFHDMWSFGWKILVSNVIESLWKEMYQVVIGKCYSSNTLGLYTRAKDFSKIFSTNLTAIIQRVSFPVLSSIQEDKVRLKASYRKIIRCTMFITFVMMLSLAACSDTIISVLLGAKWMPCVPYLRLICFVGMFYPLHAINLNMLQVLGRSDLYLKLEIIKKIIAILPLVIGIYGNIEMMLYSSIIVNIIAYYLNTYYSGKMLNYPFIKQLIDILPSFVLAVCLATVQLLISQLDFSIYLVFSLQLVISCIFLVIFSECFKLKDYFVLKEIFTKAVSRFRMQ